MDCQVAQVSLVEAPFNSKLSTSVITSILLVTNSIPILLPIPISGRAVELVRLESWIHKTFRISISSSKIKIRRSYKISCRLISTFLDSNSSKDSKSKTRLKSRFHHKLRIMEFRWSFKGVVAALLLRSLNLSKTNLMFNILLHSLVQDQALSKLDKPLVVISLKTTLEVTLAATIMVGLITDSDRVLLMIPIMPSNLQPISLSRPTKEYSKLWITSAAHKLIMEINSKLLKGRYLKSKETTISSCHLKLPLTNSLKIKSLLDSSPYSLNKFNNRPNLKLRWIL